MRYFLRLAYDGTNYHGWQRQPNAISVQEVIETALSTIRQSPTEIVGAGRTDTGVHAREMVAHFDSDEITDKERFLTSLNRMIGHEIVVYDVLEVRPDAHARFDALSREYEYHIAVHKTPFKYRYSYYLNRIPDLEKMNQGCEILLDNSDFTSFAKLHSDSKTNICRLMKAAWHLDSITAELVFNVKADRFLRNMVRALVGTLIEVGYGKLSLDGLRKVIEKKDRCAAGVSMPAKGLFLTSIEYPKEIFIIK